MKIEIEYTEEDGWKVTQGDRYADRLSWEEMLGTFVGITGPVDNKCVGWMLTKDQHEHRRKALKIYLVAVAGRKPAL